MQSRSVPEALKYFLIDIKCILFIYIYIIYNDRSLPQTSTTDTGVRKWKKNSCQTLTPFDIHS